MVVVDGVCMFTGFRCRGLCPVLILQILRLRIPLTASVMVSFDMFHFLSLEGFDRLPRSERACLNDAGVGRVVKRKWRFSHLGISWVEHGAVGVTRTMRLDFRENGSARVCV